jgi:uncharacterized membrane protein
MDSLSMGKGRQMARAAFGVTLCLALVPARGGAESEIQQANRTDAAGGAARHGHAAADTYDIVNLAPGIGYRSRINTRGQAAYEYVSLTDRLRVGFFDGDRISDISPPASETAALGDMNEKGEVAAYGSLPFGPGFGLLPFRWSQAAGWTALPILGAARDSFTGAINDGGVIVGASATGAAGGQYRAVRWGASNTLTALATPAGFGESFAGDINASGVSVGNAYDPAGLAHAFIWDAAGRPTDLGTFGASQAAAMVNNRRGEVAGWLNLYETDFQSFLWSPGKGVTRVGLHALPGELNNVGELVGRIYNADTGIDHAYVFSRARGLVDLHRPPFTSSVASDLDDSGTVVGEMLSNIPGAYAQRAYRWARSGAAVDLNTRLPDAPDGLIVTQALRISPRGDIIANSNAGLLLLRRTGGTDAPVLGPIRMPEVVSPAQPFALTLSFRDRNRRQTHSATVDWGDGSAPQVAGISERNGRGELSAAHAYASAGDYTIVVRVTDAAGRSTVQARRVSIFQTCVPGIVGEGSLPAALGAGAQATLVFRLAAPLVAPCGKTRRFTFQLQGRLAFKGERLERVSRIGNTVHLEGTGQLDGQPGYRFSIDATDGQHVGASAPDRLTVRIDQPEPATGAPGKRGGPVLLNYAGADRKSHAAPEGKLPPAALRLIN